jgi:hypothetical protein
VLVPSLIDTGASYPFMHVNLWHHVEDLSKGSLQLKTTYVTSSQGSTGHRQRVLGNFQCDAKLDSVTASTMFYVGDRQPVGILVGGEWSLNYRATTNYTDKLLCLRRPQEACANPSGASNVVAASSVRDAQAYLNDVRRATKFAHCPEMLLNAYAPVHRLVIDTIGQHQPFPAELCTSSAELAQVAAHADELAARLGLLFRVNSKGYALPYVATSIRERLINYLLVGG